MRAFYGILEINVLKAFLSANERKKRKVLGLCACGTLHLKLKTFALLCMNALILRTQDAQQQLFAFICGQSALFLIFKPV